MVDMGGDVQDQDRAGRATRNNVPDPSLSEEEAARGDVQRPAYPAEEARCDIADADRPEQLIRVGVDPQKGIARSKSINIRTSYGNILHEGLLLHVQESRDEAI